MFEVHSKLAKEDSESGGLNALRPLKPCTTEDLNRRATSTGIKGSSPDPQQGGSDISQWSGVWLDT
jgi:hypothetical protein